MAGDSALARAGAVVDDACDAMLVMSLSATADATQMTPQSYRVLVDRAIFLRRQIPNRIFDRPNIGQRSVTLPVR
jgi:hypothetical protein